MSERMKACCYWCGVPIHPCDCGKNISERQHRISINETQARILQEQGSEGLPYCKIDGGELSVVEGEHLFLGQISIGISIPAGTPPHEWPFSIQGLFLRHRLPKSPRNQEKLERR